MDDSGSARRAAFLSDGWWRRNPIVAAVLTVAVAAAVLQRTRAGGAPQAQCRAGACSALQAQVEAHVALVHGELQEMVTSLCPTDPALGVPSPWEQQREEAGQERNVNVPSCDKLRETGLEAYYGNLNMLLVEAWLAKILPALRRPLQRGKILQAGKAELITLQADGLLGGAIFVQQLRLPTGAAAPAAMMLGIHRLPRHKAMRQMLGRAPEVVVTDALVAKVKAWCRAQRIERLVVCPYSELNARLQALGFAPAVKAGPAYLFGDTPVAGELCEEAGLFEVRVDL